MKVYVISYFCKHSQETTPILACDDRAKVKEIVGSLDSVIGYQAGVGIYGQKADGYYRVQELDLIPSDALDSQWQRLLDARR